jgi:hypothetical protein
MAVTSGSSAGGSVSDFRKMGKASMEAELSIGAGDTGVADALGAIGGVLNTKGAAMNAELKATMKKRQDEVDAFGKDIETVFTDLAPEVKELGQESYQKAQDDVYGLREAFVNCAGDKRCEGDVMVKLNETKTRHSTDAENQKGLIGLWEGELDEDGIRGESSADIKAMKPEDRLVMKEFATNKTKRVVYLNEDGTGPGDVLHHMWEVPVLDENEFLEDGTTPNPNFGEQVIGPDGQPAVKTESYSNEQLQDMVAIKETVNGDKYQDLLQAEKEKKGNNQTVSDNAALKKAVGDMIPKTQQALRSWAYSNPAEQDYLDVSQYLIDHPILDGQYLKLGLEDQPTEPNPNYVEGGSEPEFIGDGVINHEDFIASEDKEAIVKKIMNADDVNLSHEILTDIYASVASNEIQGLPKRARGTEGVGNIEYHPERNELPNASNKQKVAEHDQKENQEKLTKLQSLADPEVLKSMGGANENEIAKMLGLDPNEKIYNDVTGEYESIKTYIATAINKKAAGKTAPAGLSGAEKLQWYKDNG